MYARVRASSQRKTHTHTHVGFAEWILPSLLNPLTLNEKVCIPIVDGSCVQVTKNILPSVCGSMAVIHFGAFGAFASPWGGQGRMHAGTHGITPSFDIPQQHGMIGKPSQHGGWTPVGRIEPGFRSDSQTFPPQIFGWMIFPLSVSRGHPTCDPAQLAEINLRRKSQ